MKPFILAMTILMLTACAGNGQIEEEEITNNNGILSACGNGPGLDPCRDYNGESFNAEMSDAPLSDEDNAELAKDAEIMRDEAN